MASVDDVVLPDPSERKPHVLIVDDEFMVRLALVEFLQECGFKAFGASNADEAMQALQTSTIPFDLVLTDVRMPGEINGFELAKWIREKKPGLPVLYVSGDASKAETAHELCEKLIPKPFDFNFMLAKIRQELAASNKKTK